MNRFSNRRGINESLGAYHARLKGVAAAIDKYLRVGVPATPRPRRMYGMPSLQPMVYVVASGITQGARPGLHCGTLRKMFA